jgi:preprotein translocase subunit SecG
MAQILPYIQLAVSILLIVVILFQAKGTALSAVFGGEGNIFRTRRGFEKILFILTIVLAIIFAALGITAIIVG